MPLRGAARIAGAPPAVAMVCWPLAGGAGRWPLAAGFRPGTIQRPTPLPVTTHNPMPRRAFTLIELLVVIAIMITLMALIMGGVMLAKRTAQRAKAVSLISAVASAIDQYRTLNSSYPESWTVPATPPPAWTDAFSAAGISSPPSSGTEVYGSVFVQSLGPPIEYKGAQNISDDAWKVINVQLAYQLASLITDNTKDGQLIDPWKKPLRYRPFRFYPCTVADTALPRVDRITPPGQDSFQLWSAGPNGTDESSNPGDGGDDIPNWVKSP